MSSAVQVSPVSKTLMPAPHIIASNAGTNVHGEHWLVFVCCLKGNYTLVPTSSSCAWNQRKYV